VFDPVPIDEIGIQRLSLFQRRNNMKRLLSTILLLLLATLLFSTLTVHYLDVGQGDSILIQTPYGETILIDAGDWNQGSVVSRYLRDRGIEVLDYLIATHPHADHIGGLIEVIRTFEVEKVYMPRVAHTTATYRELLLAIQAKGLGIHSAKNGVILPVKGLEAYFISPSHDGYSGLNNHSAVLCLEYDGITLLFMGDAEEEVEHEILNNYPTLSVDILKAGHHGSRTSSGESFISSISPKIAIIMCGEGNRYGHPHQPTLDTLAKNGVQILRTDLNGTIVVQTDGETFSVSAEKRTQTPTVQPEPVTEAMEYIGNINTKVFHVPTCSFLPAKHNRIFFSSREEAVKAGYRPCGRCNP